MKKLTILLASLGLILTFGACTVEKEQEGEMPEVEVTEGELPEVDVDAADIEIGTEEKTVEVPDVDVTMEEKTVTVPDVDIEPPKDDDESEG